MLGPESPDPAGELVAGAGGPAAAASFLAGVLFFPTAAKLLSEVLAGLAFLTEAAFLAGVAFLAGAAFLVGVAFLAGLAAACARSPLSCGSGSTGTVVVADRSALVPVEARSGDDESTTPLGPAEVPARAGGPDEETALRVGIAAGLGARLSVEPVEPVPPLPRICRKDSGACARMPVTVASTARREPRTTSWAAPLTISATVPNAPLATVHALLCFDLGR